MAEGKKDSPENKEGEGKEAPAAKPKRKFGGILVAAAANLVVVVLVLGFMVYTKIIYRRPIITEPKERARIVESAEEKEKSGPTQVLDLPTLTVNILSRENGAEGTPAAGAGGANAEPNSASGEPHAKLASPGPIKGRIHYALVGTSLEYNDPTQEKKLKELIPVLNDKISTLIARRSYSELTNVQGRFVLRQQVIDTINRLLGTKLIVNVYFPQFLVQ